jgi:hypothetical protein
MLIVYIIHVKCVSIMANHHLWLDVGCNFIYATIGFFYYMCWLQLIYIHKLQLQIDTFLLMKHSPSHKLYLTLTWLLENLHKPHKLPNFFIKLCKNCSKSQSTLIQMQLEKTTFERLPQNGCRTKLNFQPKWETYSYASPQMDSSSTLVNWMKSLTI